MNNEVWKDIPGYENLYQISNLKRIKSLERLSYSNKLLKEKILKKSKNRNYEFVWLSKNNKQKVYYVDRLYYELFNAENNYEQIQ